MANHSPAGVPSGVARGASRTTIGCRPDRCGEGPRGDRASPGRPIVIERRAMSLRTHSVNGPAGPAANISTAPGRGRRLRAAVKRGPSRDSVSIYCHDDRHVSHPTRSAVVRAIERARRPSPACSLGFFSFLFFFPCLMKHDDFSLNNFDFTLHAI